MVFGKTEEERIQLNEETHWSGGPYDSSRTGGPKALRDLFRQCIEASEILGMDKKFRQQLLDTRQKLAPMQMGKHGQPQQWLDE